jgi:hypothetical protein
MSRWQLACWAAWGLVANPLLASPQAAQPPPDVLRRPGETTVFSFRTSRGKTVSLCEGPKAAYLVYRFGTAAKTELQYPAALNAGSWRKFTYWTYHRGGGVANAGMEEYRISFKNEAAEYELTDRTEAYLTSSKEEDYRREVGLNVVVSGKSLDITARQASVSGDLALSDEQRKRVKLAEEE